MLLALTPIVAGGLLTLLIYVIVLLIIGGLIFWAVNKLSAAFGIPEPIRTVIIVLLVVIIVIGLVYLLLGATPTRL